ncbi:MAG: peptidoglycan-binding protein [Acidimicrobiales bacterium]
MPLVTPDQTQGGSSHHSSGDSAADEGQGPAPHRSPAEDTPASSGRSRRLALAGAGIAALAIGGIAAASFAFDGDDSTAPAEEPTATIRAVEAGVSDLSESLTVDGAVAYGDPISVSSSVDGTITNVADADALLERGDVLYAVNESPVVVFYGDVPLYRPIGADTSDGGDIEVLETNLAALGFDADGTLVVDREVDEATIEAIDAWQADIGADTDGAVDPAQVLVVAGPAVVADVVADVGTAIRVGNPVLSLQVTYAATTITAPSSNGLATEVPDVGDRFETGDVAYEIDTDPVVVIVGDVPIDRVLAEGIDDGPDIELLEQTLVSLGYDDDGDLEVDEDFDEHTASALAEWEDDLGIEPDGVVWVGQFVVVPAGSEVTDVAAERGDTLRAGATVFELGVSTRTVTGVIDEADADLIAVGDTVEIAAGDQTTTGVVVGIDDPQADPADPATETVTFTIEPDTAIEIDAATAQLDVEITITTRLAQDVITVPATALISTGDGGYAVEVVRGDTTAFVAVEPGAFADGMVEVTGIDAGTAVVVPS